MIQELIINIKKGELVREAKDNSNGEHYLCTSEPPASVNKERTFNSNPNFTTVEYIAMHDTTLSLDGVCTIFDDQDRPYSKFLIR